MDTTITLAAPALAAAAKPQSEAITFDLPALRNIAWRARTMRPAIRDEAGKLIGTADPRLPEDLTVEDLSAHLSYGDRDSYLAWVAAWKETYAALSVQIRADKTACRDAQRAGDPKASNMQAALHDSASSARMLLALRRVGKIDSWSRATASRAAAGREA